MTKYNRLKELNELLDILSEQVLSMWYKWYEAKKELNEKSSPEEIKKVQILKNKLAKRERKKCNCAIDINLIMEAQGLIPKKPKNCKAPANFKKGYHNQPYPTPNIFVNKYKNKSALIIGTGHSTKNLLKYKDKLRQRFDVIIGINGSVEDFEEILDFHVVMDRLQSWMIKKRGWFDGKYRKDLPRVLNWKTVHRFPQDLNIIKTWRCGFKNNLGGTDVDIRKFINNDEEGLLIGPQDRIGLSVGTPVTQAIHLVGILGCNKVYLSGTDLLFRNECDHYNGGKLYRTNELKCKPRNKSLIVEIEHKGKKYVTIEYFISSAEWMNEVLIPKLCRPMGLGVYDFSDGLLSNDIQIDLDKFFNT